MFTGDQREWCSAAELCVCSASHVFVSFVYCAYLIWLGFLMVEPIHLDLMCFTTNYFFSDR
jgi:hypothetical protein